jgi:hypothetical protein
MKPFSLEAAPPFFVYVVTGSRQLSVAAGLDATGWVAGPPAQDASETKNASPTVNRIVKCISKV